MHATAGEPLFVPVKKLPTPSVPTGVWEWFLDRFLQSARRLERRKQEGRLLSGLPVFVKSGQRTVHTGPAGFPVAVGAKQIVRYWPLLSLNRQPL
jgi:hypothetical protein